MSQRRNESGVSFDHQPGLRPDAVGKALPGGRTVLELLGCVVAIDDDVLAEEMALRLAMRS